MSISMYNKYGNPINIDNGGGKVVAYNYFTISTKLPSKLLDLSMKVGNIRDISSDYSKIYELIGTYSDFVKSIGTTNLSGRDKDNLKLMELKLGKLVINLLSNALKFHESSHYTIIDADTIGGMRSPDYFFWNGFLGKIPYMWSHKWNTLVNNAFGLFKLDFGYIYPDMGLLNYNLDYNNYYNTKGKYKLSDGINYRKLIVKISSLPSSQLIIDRLKLLLVGFSNIILDFRVGKEGVPYHNYLLGYLYRYFPEYVLSNKLKLILPTDVSSNDLVNNNVISPLAYMMLNMNKYRVDILRSITKLFSRDKSSFNQIAIDDGSSKLPNWAIIHDHVISSSEKYDKDNTNDYGKIIKPMDMIIKYLGKKVDRKNKLTFT